MVTLGLVHWCWLFILGDCVTRDSFIRRQSDTMTSIAAVSNFQFIWPVLKKYIVFIMKFVLQTFQFN